MQLKAFVTISLLLLLILSIKPQTPSKSPDDLLTVDFISVGSGIDRRAEEKFLNYLKEFQEKNKLVLNYKIEYWGKEGERKYIFDLRKVSNRKRVFSESVRKMFEGSKLVVVN